MSEIYNVSVESDGVTVQVIERPTQAAQVGLAAIDGLAASNVQAAISELVADVLEKMDAADAALFATAAQGDLADSAVQPGDLATVATTGAYSSLSGRPTLGTAAALDVNSGVQAYSAKLAAIAALIWASDTAPYFTGSGAIDKYGLSAFMRGLMGTSSASALLTAIGALPAAGGTVAGALTVTGSGGLGGNVVFDSSASMTIRSINGVVSYASHDAFAGNLYYSDAWHYAKNGYGFVIGTDFSGNFTVALAPSNAAGAGASATVTPMLAVYTDGSVSTLLSTGALKINGNNVVNSERLLLARPLTIAGFSSVTNVNGAFVFGTDFGGGSGPAYGNGVKWIRLNQTGIATVSSDTAFTLTYLTDAPTQIHTGTLTADRTITLSATNAVNGARFRVTRKGAGAFNLSVGGLKSLATNTWCDVEYDGSAWVLTGYGSL